jgi:uncharacterized protein involved in exopolysaccharide biosynthesis
VQENSDDEIDLGEVFSALVSGWKALLFFTSFFFIGSAYYAINVPIEKFESVATIQLSNANGSKLSKIGGIASLAGISIPTGSSEQITLETRLNSRALILGLDEKVRIFSDEYLNPYLNQNAEADDNPSFGNLKSIVLSLLSSEETFTDEVMEEKDQLANLSSKIEHEVVNAFKSNLRIEELDSGAFKVFFKHSSPIRAAEILNAALEEAITQIDLEKEEADRANLNYLEGKLISIQKDLEAAVDAMQKYAVEYNLGSIQDLASSSFRTDNLRDELSVLRDTLIAIDYLRTSNSFNKDYLSKVRTKFPFIGTLDFRSRLNLPADINTWIKPTDNEFEAAKVRVSIQIEDLTALVSDLEKKARSTANEARMFSDLQRNVKIQETLYEVVIKQFESQSLSSGFPGKSVEFYDSGVPPIYKVEPRRPLIVAIGLVIGFFMGSVFVLIRAAISGVIYSKTTLYSKSKKIGILIKLSNVSTNLGRSFSKSSKFMHSKIQKYNGLVLFLNPSRMICGVVSTYNEGNARCLALVLMQGKRKYFEKVQLIDLNGLFKLDKGNEQDQILLGQVNAHVFDEGCEVLQPHSELSAHDLNLYIEKMRQDGTAVIILFGNLESEQNELMFLSNSFDCLFFGVQVKQTTKDHLKVIEEIILKCEKPGTMVCC